MVKITNYQNGKIYVITSKLDRTMKYVGSTCNSLSKRMVQHRGDSGKDRCKNHKVYQYFLEHGWANAEISLLESVPCRTKTELLMKEREWKDKLNPPLNMVNPYRSDEEKKLYHEKYSKEWYEQHKEQIKQWYEQHKEQRKEQIKKWYEQHKEQCKEQYKQWYEQHKEQHKTKTECPNCKKTLLKRNLEKHMETKTCKEQYFRTNYAFDDCNDDEYNLHYIED